jgi:hypothetical protein
MVKKALTTSHPERMVRALEGIAEKKIERRLERETKPGLYTGTRAGHNLVRKARIRPNGKDSAIVDGCDVIKSLDSGDAGWKAGEIIASVRLNPLEAGASQMRSSCARYEQYKVRRLRFHIPGGAGTVVSGTICTVFDYDPDDTEWTGAGSENLRVALTHAGATVEPLFKGFTRDFQRSDMASARLFLSADSAERRLTDCGRFYVVAGQNIAQNVCLGPMFLDWELELLVRSDDNEGPTGEGFCFTAGTPTNPCTVANPFSTSETRKLVSFGLQPIVVGPRSFTLPAGNYMVYAWAPLVNHSSDNFLCNGKLVNVISGDFVTDPYLNYGTAAGTYPAGENADVCMGMMWYTATTEHVLDPFDGLRVNSTFPNNFLAKVQVLAVNKGPMGTSLRETMRVKELSSRAEADTLLVRKFQQLRNEPLLEGKEAKIQHDNKPLEPPPQKPAVTTARQIIPPPPSSSSTTTTSGAGSISTGWFRA